MSCNASRLHSSNYAKSVTDKNCKYQICNGERGINELHNCQPNAKMKKPTQSLPRMRILDISTYNRLKNEAIIISAEERIAAANMHLINNERLKNDSAARKTEFQKYDNIQKTKGPKLAQLDEEANKKINYLLNRAFELRQDQEDEIKNCNSLILNTKCLAIRCAQMAEKDLIQKQMKQENRRMEEFMVQQRMLEGKKYEKAKQAEKLKKKLEATEIKQQMKENEIAREWEAAKNEEEARIRKEAAIEAQRAEIQDYKDKLIIQAKMREEFLQINAQLKDIKKIEKELVKIEIRQIQEYNKQKNDREMAFEEEVRKQKMMKEKEIAKIQASQKASQDLQMEKDELNAIRTQDKVEKEWRRKEREDAIKKIREDEELKEARQRQVEGQREGYAYEIQREKEQFDKIIKVNLEEIEKTKELERQNKMKIDKHRQDLLKQIRNKELERIEDRKKFFQEGVTYQEEQTAREKSLRNTIHKKIEELKTHNLPVKYIHGIERQLKLKD